MFLKQQIGFHCNQNIGTSNLRIAYLLALFIIRPQLQGIELRIPWLIAKKDQIFGASVLRCISLFGSRSSIETSTMHLPQLWNLFWIVPLVFPPRKMVLEILAQHEKNE